MKLNQTRNTYIKINDSGIIAVWLYFRFLTTVETDFVASPIKYY